MNNLENINLKHQHKINPLVIQMKNELNRELDQYSHSIASTSGISALVTSSREYGDCIQVVLWHETRKILLYTICKDGLIEGDNSHSFISNHLGLDAIVCKYLCKMIRTF